MSCRSPAEIATAPLASLSTEEWEMLCDGCGKCCMVKLENEDTGAYHFTSLVCRLFDQKTCRCKDYSNRSSRVPDCLPVTVKLAEEMAWLPMTCAYRLRAQNQPLFDWHPLLSGEAQSAIEAGNSALELISHSETEVPEEDWVDYLIDDLVPPQFPKENP